jgi:hypothetical protein
MNDHDGGPTPPAQSRSTQQRTRRAKITSIVWFATKAERIAWIRHTAEGIVAGTIDPHHGANDIWHTALPDVDLGPLHPFIHAGDQLDFIGRDDERRLPIEAGIRDAARALLTNDAFWSQST